MKALIFLTLCVFTTLTYAGTKLTGELGVGYYLKGPKSAFPYFSFNYDDWTFSITGVFKTYDYDKFLYLSIGFTPDINSITHKEHDNALLMIDLRTYLARWFALETRLQQDVLDDYHGSRYSYGFKLTIPLLRSGNLATSLSPSIIHENRNYAKLHYEKFEIRNHQGLNHMEFNIALVAKITKSTELIWFYNYQKLDKHIKDAYGGNIDENGILLKLSF